VERIGVTRENQIEMKIGNNFYTKGKKVCNELNLSKLF
jgi:hypothetical protein